MTPDQRAKLEALSKCKFAVGSYDKRFVRELSSFPDWQGLSERQDRFLEQVYHKYRAQIGYTAHKATCKVCTGEIEPVKSRSVTKESAAEVDKLERWKRSVGEPRKDKIHWWHRDYCTQLIKSEMVLMRYDWPDGERIYQFGIYDPLSFSKWTDGNGGWLETPDYYCIVKELLPYIQIGEGDEWQSGRLETKVKAKHD